jgi:hypothetical protein
MSVTGSFTTAAPLAPNLVNQLFTPAAYSFSDGLTAFSNLYPGSTNNFFRISTDASGLIYGWTIDLGGAQQYIFLSNSLWDSYEYCSGNAPVCVGEGGYIMGGTAYAGVGSWNLENLNFTPEPSTGLLGTVSLLLIIEMAARRRTSPASSIASL